MSSFPTLSKGPVYPLAYEREDNIIKTELEGGYQHRRARFTRTRLLWTLEFRNMSSSDVSTLLSFEASDGAGPFTWTDPETSTSYTVVFEKPVKYQLYEVGLYAITVILRQV